MRPARQVRRNAHESEQARARRLKRASKERAEQRLTSCVVGAVRLMTDMIREDTAYLDGVLTAYRSGPSANLVERLGARLDDTRCMLDLARDEAHMAWLSERPS